MLEKIVQAREDIINLDYISLSEITNALIKKHKNINPGIINEKDTNKMTNRAMNIFRYKI